MRWFTRLFGKRKLEQQLDSELRFHLDRRTADLVATGVEPAEARRRARLEFGGLDRAKEECRESRGTYFLENWLQDLRFGLRMLRKSPGFALIAILTLALGIGASTAIFSVVDAVLLRPLPYPHPQRIARVWEQAPDGHRMNLADADFQDFRAENHTLSAMAEYTSVPESVSGGSAPVRMNVGFVSRGFFATLGVEPFHGRTFAPNEQVYHGAPAMIVSYEYWQRYLDGQRDLSHIRLSMSGKVYPVVGVMPRGFNFPRGVSAWVSKESVFGLSTSRTAHSWRCLGRVRAGFTMAQTRADLDAIAGRIRAKYGEKVDLTSAAVIPLADAIVGNVRTALLTLFGAVILLFLVACANVAGLLLLRMAARRKELAMRATLGASRVRLAQQMLAESLALAFVGGALGVLMAAWAIKLLPALLPADLPRQQGIALNATVLFFTLAATLAVAVGLGLFTAWRAGRVDLSDALSAASRSYSSGSRRLRAVLVVGEMAATLVMLVGAGLLGRSFLKLTSVSPGFSGQNLLILKFSPPLSQRALNFHLSQAGIVRQTELVNEALTRLRSIPGVQSAGVTGALPIADADGFPDGTFLILNGRSAPTNWHAWGLFALNPKQSGHADYAVTSAGFFTTVGIPLMRGRLFNAQDGPDAPNVAVISETLAREKWPHENPIGRMIDFGNMDDNLKPLTIVGVVGDIRAEGLDRPPSPIVYVDYRQRGMGPNTSPAIVLRTTMPPGAIVPTARGIFRELDPDIPVQFSTFNEELGGWMAERRFLLLLAGLFAGAALALAAVGIYGLVANSVARRTQEIGIRVALGAQRTDVLGLVIKEGARLAAIGVAIGVAVSLATTRLISSLLFDVKATDPLTFLAVVAVLCAVVLFACYIPARRATRVDPVVALRQE